MHPGAHMDFKTIVTLLAFFVKEFSYATAQGGFSFPDAGTRNEGQENRCTTNTGSQGTCVAFSRCTTIPRTLTSSNQPKICRWDGIQLIICCPLQNPNPVVPLIVSSPASSLPADCVAMPQRQNNPRIKRNPAQSGFAVSFVVGGMDAKAGDWPFMAALFRETDTTRRIPFCAGALISPDVVLTAAHCFYFESQPDMTYVAIFGATNLIDGDGAVVPIARDVSRVIMHESYQYPVAYHDIAIMKLSLRVPFTGSARPICLPYNAISRQDFAGQTATILGWGRLTFGGAPAKTLQFAEVPITTNVECQNSYRNLNVGENFPFGFPNNIICAGSESSNKDTCQGDSGGPLVMKDPRGNKAILVGIVSTGFECGRHLPGVYTRVTQYLNWIAENSR